MLLVKIFSPETANKLAELGFSYVKERLNNTDVFCFQLSDELMKELKKNYSNNMYIIDRRLRF